MLICPSETANLPATRGTVQQCRLTPRPAAISATVGTITFPDALSPADYAALFMAGTLSQSGIKETAIIHPSDTIVLGEKIAQRGDFYMDMLAGNGDDFAGAVAQDQHSGKGQGTGTGGSNYVFADGSTRYNKYGSAFDPLNLWAVSDGDRAADMISFH